MLIFSGILFLCSKNPYHFYNSIFYRVDLSKQMEWSLIRTLNYLNGSIFCTLGASGISVNREVAKNDMRLRASKFAGMSIAVSLTVSSKWKRLIWHEQADYISITSRVHIHTRCYSSQLNVCASINTWISKIVLNESRITSIIEVNNKYHLFHQRAFWQGKMDTVLIGKWIGCTIYFITGK